MDNMKRLFEVDGVYFDNKMTAKAARGDLIPAEPGKPAHFKHTVSKGPDHMGNHGRTVPKTTHRAPQVFQPKV